MHRRKCCGWLIWTSLILNMANFGESTREYRTIQRHYASLVDNLGKTVDPAHFARRLREESLISESLVEAAMVTTVPGSQRVGPTINAVLAQIKLKANNFHTFMTILKAENSCLADTISEYYTSSLELHALRVLERVSEWKELGHQLNIDPVKLLMLSQSGRDSCYCLEQVVIEWLKEDKEASWEKLCRALERMGNETEILKGIREQYVSAGVPAAISSEVPSALAKLPPNFMGDDTDQQHCAGSVVAKEVEEFVVRFEDLTYRLQTEMEKKETPVKKFRHSITLLPPNIREEHLNFVTDSLKNIKHAEDIEEIFMYLNLYWNFFDYTLLQHFVARYGSDELKEEMEKYAIDLEVFRKKTTVDQLLKVCPNGFRSEKIPPNFTEVVSKLDQNASEYTLEELEHFRQKLCRECCLPTFAVMLVSFQKGSITIVWHIPSSEVYRFHNTAIQWNSISTKLLQFEVDELSFASHFSAQALMELPSLTHIYFRWHGIVADKMALLSSSLRTKSCLQHLDLSWNKFGSGGATNLAQALIESTALSHLDLGWCDIGGDGMASLSSSLKNKQRFQHLDLRGNKFGTKGAKYLAQALTENTALTYLDLSWCNIGTKGIALLSPGLRNTSCLHHLNLSGNNFGSKGAEYLAEALMEGTALTYLDLRSCNIYADGIGFLLLSLRNKSHLQYLNLRGNKFGSKGAEYFAQALTENITLTHMDLSGCDIDAEGIALLSSLGNKLGLQHLDLRGNKFSSYTEWWKVPQSEAQSRSEIGSDWSETGSNSTGPNSWSDTGSEVYNRHSSVSSACGEDL